MTTSLRSLYLYLVCLITLVMVIFAAVSVVRNVVAIGYPDPLAYGFESAYGPDGAVKQDEADRKARQQAAQDSQRRQSVLGLVGSGAMLVIAGPAYAYHWRRIQAENAAEQAGDRTGVPA